MFLIRTFVDRSPIAGRGVFAAEPLPNGAPIWEFTPGTDAMVTPQDYRAMPEGARAAFERFLYPDRIDGREVYIYCADNMKFMNHSAAPNVSTGGLVNVALRDIAVGDELTCDYGAFVWFAPEDFPEFV